MDVQSRKNDKVSVGPFACLRNDPAIMSSAVGKCEMKKNLKMQPPNLKDILHKFQLISSMHLINSNFHTL